MPRDIHEFLEGYPSIEDRPDLEANFSFYSNSLRCRPDNMLIDEIHETWFGDYDTLEHHHGFIQWLFPIREHGMNYESQPLQKHEVEAMTANSNIMGRILNSYRLMLDFYGMRLVSPDTGLVERSLPPSNFSARYRNIVWSTHNNLRISRILKCLSELGLEHLNAGFLLHVLQEQSEHDELDSAALKSSMDRWWANCLRSAEEREWIGSVIKQVRQPGNFVFTRDMYESALRRRAETGSLRGEDAVT